LYLGLAFQAIRGLILFNAEYGFLLAIGDFSIAGARERGRF
jgi:hypothetical protein